MAHPGWLPNKLVKLEIPQRAVAVTRVIGVQDKRLVLLAPTQNAKTLWPHPNTPATVIIESGGQEFRSPGIIRERKLKPLPLLYLELERDIPFAACAEERQKKILAIASGKGGTGKTFIAVNLAWELATLGHKVVLVDLDLGTANVTTALGIQTQSDLAQVIDGSKPICEVEYRLAANLSIIPGIAKNSEYAALSPWQFQRLIDSLSLLEEKWEYILLDTSAGLSPNTTSFLYCADYIVLVINDAPPAIIDGYGLIKAVHSQFWPPKIGLIVNRAFHASEAEECAQRFITTAKEFLSVPVSYLGPVHEDTAVIASIRASRPTLALYPQAKASSDLKAVTGRILQAVTESEIKYRRVLP